MGKVVKQDVIKLQPGYRSDVLVKLDKPGTYLMINDAAPANGSVTQRAESRNVLATIIVEGTQSFDIPPVPGPDVLAAYKPHKSLEAADMTNPADVITAFYGFKTVAGMTEFQIDGETYDPAAPPKKLVLGDAQEWHVTTNGNHPFHIHVNPFEVISVTNSPPAKDKDGKPIPADIDPSTMKKYIEERVWKDTFLIPRNTKVVLRMRYERYIGTFVQHCHILDHEDRGMMQAVEVVLP